MTENMQIYFHLTAARCVRCRQQHKLRVREDRKFRVDKFWYNPAVYLKQEDEIVREREENPLGEPACLPCLDSEKMTHMESITFPF